MDAIYEDPIEKEARIQEAMAAYKKGKFSSIRKAAAYHGVSHVTLSCRLNGRQARILIQKQQKLQLLSDSYEDVIVD
jgi:hypothetical protein